MLRVKHTLMWLHLQDAKTDSYASVGILDAIASTTIEDGSGDDADVLQCTENVDLEWI